VRLFVAVWPPADVVDLLAAMARPQVDGVRWTTRAQWHVTLRFLGQVALDEATAAFARIDVASSDPVSAVMGPATACLGRGVLQVPVNGLDELARLTAEATAGLAGPGGRPEGKAGPGGRPEGKAGPGGRPEGTAGPGRQGRRGDDRPFHGHLTLARSRSRKGDLRPMRGTPLAARWTVTELTLVASTPGREGSRYEVMSSLALG